MSNIQVIRGMRDIFPDQVIWWQRMERTLIDVMQKYGYGEIRTPFLEQSELFKRSIGEQTDIVEKEMYTFRDRDESLLTLRPEGTASVIRAYIEQTQWKKEPITRWGYLGPMFRHEKPQKGRYRQFTQVGAELIGSAEPAADVELIDVMMSCLFAIGLKDMKLQINSLGCPVCRPGYRQDLVGYLSGKQSKLCENCRRRMISNPLRVLDCKESDCIQVSLQAPRMLEKLCEACATHFEFVVSGLRELSLGYEINDKMVRGLDYYTRTAFEVVAEGLGAQNAVAGGGRYDGLVAQLGGPQVEAVGFSAGLDRILINLLQTLDEPTKPDTVFFVSLGEKAWKASLQLMKLVRKAGVAVESDVRMGSMKSQMKRADKAQARFVMILGQNELENQRIIIRDMRTRVQEKKQQEIALSELPVWLSANFGSCE